MAYKLRTATLDDQQRLHGLIERSVRELSANDYTPEQIKEAIGNTFGVDTQLIKDETYFVVEEQSSGQIVGCGGWSFRKTLFGSDFVKERSASELDPASEAAKIRAFFVDPSITRAGLGSMLLSHCEAEATARGFRKLELMSTLPGQRFYAAKGYIYTGDHYHELSPGLKIKFISMRKSL
ncbi:N-acetyltransferase [Rhizodiscina lignyota]|uniref:N-acetyltransferase n=1 Tax=Rhizodiscina lignyota TaxID=1504668 RepID=A0A9P4IU70_9PEZI|nr:N-acetyltransferase [Rhizodiscina lignyota]